MFKTPDFLPVLIAAFVVFAFAVIGLAETNTCTGDLSCWLVEPFKILFGQFTAPTQPPILVTLAQQSGKFILLIGAFFTAVPVFVRAARHDIRLALARRKKDHIIVCGLGDTGMQVVHNMHSALEEVVVIDRADDTLNAKACDRQGIPVLRGEATNSDVMTLAGALRARAIIVCTGDDATNVDVALNIKNLACNRRRPGSASLVVQTEMRDEWLFSHLIDHDRQRLGSNDVDLRLFNIYENSARLLLKSLLLPPGPEIESGAFVIFGFGTLGQQIMLHLIQAAPATIGTKSRIVVIDRRATRKRATFMQTYPAAEESANISFYDVDISTDNPKVWSEVEAIVGDLPLLGVAICFTHDQTSLYAGLNVRRLLDNVLRIHVPIFVRLGHHYHLGKFAAAMEEIPKQRLRFEVFGNLKELLSPEILINGSLDALAKVLHKQYRDSRQAAGVSYSADKSWELLPEALKTSNRRRADNMQILLTRAGFRIVASPEPNLIDFTVGEIELLAQLEHRRWMIERRLLGVSYGKVHSSFPPRNELLVDWKQVPEAERERNRMDFKSLPKTLAQAGFELRREHKILAIGSTIGKALSDLESAVANKVERLVVLADVDSAEGRKAAQFATMLPDSALWLISSQFPRHYSDTDQLKGLFECATGWVTREHFCGAQATSGSMPVY